MKIAIVYPSLPPALDAIGQYTAILARELSSRAEVVLVTADEGSDPVPGVRTLALFQIAPRHCVSEMLPGLRAERPDVILLQYNPFSYGKWGLNLSLPGVLHGLRAHNPGVRIAVMLHETYTPPVNWKLATFGVWQRLQLRMLAKVADHIFCSCNAWVRDVSVMHPPGTVDALPVSSNIPVVPIDRTQARARLGIADDVLVLGLFGTAHISRLLSWVGCAAETLQAAGKRVVVLYIGPDAPTVVPILAAVPTIASEGPLDAREVSLRFAAMDIHLAPYLGGVSTRRTTLMTGLQHAVATVSTRGPQTDDLLSRLDGESLLLADLNGPEQFVDEVVGLADDPDRRDRIGHAGRQRYDSEFAWPLTADRVLAVLAQRRDRR